MGLLKWVAEQGLEKEPVRMNKPDLPSEKYLELARKAGFEHAQSAINIAEREAKNEQFKQFLAQNGITAYPEKAVRDYMWAITPRHYRWTWANVTSRDYSPAWHQGVTGSAYIAPIPEAVLMTMANIRESWPEAFFQATVIESAPKVDPFLRVTVDGTHWYIIERWDEPSFRM